MSLILFDSSLALLFTLFLFSSLPSCQSIHLFRVGFYLQFCALLPITITFFDHCKKRMCPLVSLNLAFLICYPESVSFAMFHTFWSPNPFLPFEMYYCPLVLTKLTVLKSILDLSRIKERGNGARPFIYYFY